MRWEMRDREKRRRGYGEMRGMEKKGKGRGAVKRIKRWWETGRKREKKREKGGGLWEDDERQRKERGGVNCTLGLGFFLFILGFFKMLEWLNRFGSIGFRLWKPKPNRTRIFLWFFKRLICFFLGSVFSVIFFPGFFGLFGLSVFLLTPMRKRTMMRDFRGL